MKNKDKLLYVSAAVLTVGSVASVKATTVRTAEVRQASVNANNKLDLSKALQERQATAQDKTTQGQIRQSAATA